MIGWWTFAVGAVLVAETWWGQGGWIRVPLPIAGGKGFPLPVAFWTTLALYTAWYGRRAGLSAAVRRAWAVRLGFGLHILALIAALGIALVKRPPADLSLWYLRYGYGAWMAALLAGFLVAVRLTTRWRVPSSRVACRYGMPFLAGYILFWFHALCLVPRLTMTTTIVGISALALASRLSVKRLGRWWRPVLISEPVFLGGIFVIALAFRLFYAVRVMSNPDYWNAGSDGPIYDTLAWAMARGEPPPADLPWWASSLFSAGYVRVLAALYAVFGRDYFRVCAVQSVVGALACLVLYAIAKSLFGRSTARVAAVFSALSFPMIFAAASIGHQALDLFWTLLVIWCLVAYVRRPERWGRWIVGIGVLLGWAALTREENLSFWVALLGWFWLGMRRVLGWRRTLLHTCGLSLGLLAVVVPLSWSGGGRLFDRIEHLWFFYQHTPTHIHTWFNPWQNPEAAWALFLEQPLNVMAKVGAAMLANFTTMFFHQDYGSFDPVFLVRGSLYYYGMWFYAFSLALFGLGVVCWEAVRRPAARLDWWLLLILLTSRTIVHLVLASAYRYRVPLEPYLIMLAAVGLMRLLNRPCCEPS